MALAQSSPQFNEMDRKQRALRLQMNWLQSLYVKGSMTSEEYGRSEKLIKRRIAEVALPLTQSGNRVMRMLDNFPALWERLTREEKKRIIWKMAKVVWLKDGMLECVEFRELFRPNFWAKSP